MVYRRAGRAEHRHGGREFGEQPEPLDELALDPQHPPRVGVHPLARAARVQQPLVGRARADLAAAQQHRPLLVLPIVRRVSVMADEALDRTG